MSQMVPKNAVCFTFYGKARISCSVEVGLDEIFEQWRTHDNADSYQAFCDWIDNEFGEEASWSAEVTDVIDLQCDWDDFPISLEDFQQWVETRGEPPHVRGQLDFYGNMVDEFGRKIS